MSKSGNDKKVTALGALLRSMRLEAGFTLQNIAEILGISKIIYTYYEIGCVTPDPVILNKLARLYNVPLETFLPGNGKKGEQDILEELKAMIPSETVRQYVLDTGWMFTDMERAALIYNNRNLLLMQTNAWLRIIRDRTEDEALRKQITENLNEDEQAIRAFKSNPDSRCFYVLNVREDYGGREGDYIPHGYFSDWGTAYSFGRKEKSIFEIEKYLMNGIYQHDDGTCGHHYIGQIRFNEDGKIICVFSNEIPGIEFDSKRFTDLFFEVPKPFERGDIVKLIDGGYGIMETSQEEWERIKTHAQDYSDVGVHLAYFDEEHGTFNYENANPLELEIYHPNETGNDLNGLRDKILLSRSRADRGEGSLDELYQLTMEYRRLHEQTDQNAREEKAILKALGMSRWITLDRLYKRVKAYCDCSKYTVCEHMNRLVNLGYVQSVYPPGTDDVLYCGLITPPQE